MDALRREAISQRTSPKNYRMRGHLADPGSPTLGPKKKFHFRLPDLVGKWVGTFWGTSGQLVDEVHSCFGMDEVHLGQLLQEGGNGLVVCGTGHAMNTDSQRVVVLIRHKVCG